MLLAVIHQLKRQLAKSGMIAGGKRQERKLVVAGSLKLSLGKRKYFILAAFAHRPVYHSGLQKRQPRVQPRKVSVTDLSCTASIVGITGLSGKLAFSRSEMIFFSTLSGASA